MRSKTILLGSAATAMVLGVVPAFADNNIYVSVFGGWNSANDVSGISGGGANIDRSFDTSVTHVATTFTDTHPLHFDLNMITSFTNSGGSAEAGFVVGAAIGRDLSDWLPGLRAEVEFAYRHNGLKNVFASGHASATDTDSSNFSPGGTVFHNPAIAALAPANNVGPSTVSLAGTETITFQAATSTGFANSNPGTVRTFAIMANAWYDIKLDSPFTPYLGGGVGYARTVVKASNSFDGDVKNFAWQLGAGVNYAVDDQMSLGIGYRYFNGGDLDIEVRTLTTPAVVENYEVEDHAALLSLTWRMK